MLRFLLRLPVVRKLHERQFLFPLLVIGIVGAVLAHGALEVRPVADADGAIEGVTVAEAPDPPRPTGTRPALRGDLEKTPLTYFSDYWAQLLSEVEGHLVAVGAAPSGGVVIEPGVALMTVAAVAKLEAVAARTRLPGEATGDGVPADSEFPSSGVLAVDESVGLALVKASRDLPPFEAGSSRALTSGSYVGSVFLDASGAPAIAPGFLVGASSVVEDGDGGGEADLVISAAPPRDGTVAAVVDLDGALIGISYRGPEGVRALSVEALGRVVDEMRRGEPCRAISVAAMSAAVVELLETDGLLIGSVAAEAFAAEAGLQPGDVLLAWDGEPVTSVEDFEARYDATPAGALVPYRVLRGRRRVSGRTAMPDAGCRPVSPSSFVHIAGLGVALTWDAVAGDTGGAWVVSMVVPDGPAAAAGIEEGDVLLAVGRRAVGRVGHRSELERLAGANGPLLVSVRRGDRVLLVAVIPPASRQ